MKDYRRETYESQQRSENGIGCLLYLVIAIVVVAIINGWHP